MPTPVIRILLAGGRTTNVEHSAIRILLAGGKTTQVEHFAIRILLAGGGTTTVEGNAIRILLAGGRTTNVEHSAIRILLAGGRTMGHPVWNLQSYQLAGEESLSMPDNVVHPQLPKRGGPVQSQEFHWLLMNSFLVQCFFFPRVWPLMLCGTELPGSMLPLL